MASSPPRAAAWTTRERAYRSGSQLGSAPSSMARSKPPKTSPAMAGNARPMSAAFSSPRAVSINGNSFTLPAEHAGGASHAAAGSDLGDHEAVRPRDSGERLGVRPAQLRFGVVDANDEVRRTGLASELPGGRLREEARGRFARHRLPLRRHRVLQVDAHGVRPGRQRLAEPVRTVSRHEEDGAVAGAQNDLGIPSTCVATWLSTRLFATGAIR